MPEPGIPESFKVLIKELQSLGMDVKVLNEQEGLVSIKDGEGNEEVVSAEELNLDLKDIENDTD